MREILFRGKTDKGEWVQGDLFEVFDDGFFIHDKKCHSVKVIPETVGQFTGFGAKNDSKIFEGDIVKSEIGTYVVKFLTGSWCCSLIECEHLTLLSIISVKEIIGNIHDNPELLKERE